MKRKYILVVFFVLLFANLLTGCTDYKKQIIENANSILKENQLDGEIRLVYDRKLEGYDFYYINITSDNFEDKTDAQKKYILNNLDISIPGSKMITTPEIISQGYTYCLNYDNELERDGEIYPPKPTSTPFVMPKGDFQMSWNTYDSEYNSLGGILTIYRQGSKYTMKLVMSDGSNDTYNLSVISDGDEIRLTERPGNPYGDYMYISSNGYLYFCDNQGIIYTVPPLN